MSSMVYHVQRQDLSSYVGLNAAVVFATGSCAPSSPTWTVATCLTDRKLAGQGRNSLLNLDFESRSLGTNALRCHTNSSQRPQPKVVPVQILKH